MLLGFFLFISPVYSCENRVEESCFYEKHSFRFTYPESWHIEEESGWFSYPYVFIENDDSGLIMVLVLPKKEFKTLTEFATDYSKTTNSQSFIGNFSQGVFTKISSKSGLSGIEEKTNITFMDETSEMIRRYFVLHTEKKSAFIILQTAADERIDHIKNYEHVLASFTFLNSAKEEPGI